MNQVSNFDLDGREGISGGRSALYTHESDHINSQKAISLPSSPHEYRSQTSQSSRSSGFVANDQLVTTWNKVLESPLFHSKPLLPFQEWNIDFSELTVGARVGIGKHQYLHFSVVLLALNFDSVNTAVQNLPIIVLHFFGMSRHTILYSFKSPW
jgi:hypothetical protein